jgi:sugar (pentulose or hexulose) kinase
MDRAFRHVAGDGRGVTQPGIRQTLRIFPARVESIAVADSAALGSAMLAAHADGVSLAEMTAIFARSRLCLPRAANAAVYDRLLPAVRELERLPPAGA